MAIGQDIDITPLQIAQMTTIPANGGTLYKPQLVREAGLIGEEPSHVMQPEVVRDLDLAGEAIEVVRRGMCDVTQEQYGTAEFQYRNTRLSNQIRVCGKTGTAQSPGEGTNPHAWFTAYAPMDNPEVVVTVMVENAGEGSAVAAPIARDILDYYFFERDVPAQNP
jgi:penicillin-binding protein 2